MNLSVLSNTFADEYANKCYINYEGNEYTGEPLEAYLNLGGSASAIGNVRFIQYSNTNSAPTKGNWKRGSIIYNQNPYAIGYIGWVCTNSGTPGTWKKFGAIDPSV